ncbi:MAG: translation initiation factor [Aphanocapsa feldmannii 277cV]|uniref:Translation initiation factor n=1 Tax=Aphanocapsa feldmannii 277cV TaxID=2507553 RepID=A0A524RKI1_9CHRO|nr:MAG: translation initiation factor [Aphanocapsa feldmannii 288cV]TGG90117.1 MAG: translation initiation factor [Aphanocapsa feldmannii 277cV]
MGRKDGWREFAAPATARSATARPAAARLPRGEQLVRVQRNSRGRGGKTVTTISGIEADGATLKALAKALKAASGSGGSIKAGVIELQGDQVETSLAWLAGEGFRPRRSGG